MSVQQWDLKFVVQGILSKLQMDCGVQWLVLITVQWRYSWLVTHTEGTAEGHQAAFSTVTEFNISSSASSSVFAFIKEVLLQLVIHATARLNFLQFCVFCPQLQPAKARCLRQLQPLVIPEIAGQDVTLGFVEGLIQYNRKMLGTLGIWCS
jgi:hypothetical protein